ncbi:putative EF-hand domain-containing protein [Seiridium unicorne]|uniref:EF-hand domain-containing protein n=1 Tax=Seiridium unicorne TaxID=138068 RepID=A0ABR2UHL1_9PEZI
MAMQAGYKPSPLGYGSPRSSPFRRPESPAASSPFRQSTPPASPSKVGHLRTPSRLGDDSLPAPAPTSPDLSRPRPLPQPDDMGSPRLGSPAQIRTQPPAPVAAGNALSQLQPQQLRVLRDGFQILDRDSDGSVNREDVADMMNQLGLSSNQSELSQFFPPGGPQTMTLAVFLNSIANTLAAMSPNTELLSAFSAFDDDDSGQVDLAELRDALLNTAPEPGERALSASEVDKIMAGFSGRRAFSRSTMTAGPPRKKGEVFKYQDFVNSIMGGNGATEPASNGGSEESDE